MTAIDDIDDMLPDTHFERVEALSRATTRLRFDPYVDIDWGRSGKRSAKG